MSEDDELPALSNKDNNNDDDNNKAVAGPKILACVDPAKLSVSEYTL